LAQWLTQPDHPLTARVAVNRYWQMLFGRGLVAIRNLARKRAATHPELLDWLARDFVNSGLEYQGVLAKIVLSATYGRNRPFAPTCAKRILRTFYSPLSSQRLPAK